MSVHGRKCPRTWACTEPTGCFVKQPSGARSAHLRMPTVMCSTGKNVNTYVRSAAQNIVTLRCVTCVLFHFFTKIIYKLYLRVFVSCHFHPVFAAFQNKSCCVGHAQWIVNTFVVSIKLLRYVTTCFRQQQLWLVHRGALCSHLCGWNCRAMQSWGLTNAEV